MIFVRGARQLVTLRGAWPRRGGRHAEIGLIRDGSLLIDGGRIAEVGPTRRVENLAKARGAQEIDARGKVVVPGFVDCCARPIFASPRLRSFEARIAGAPWRPDLVDPAPPSESMPPTAARDQARRWLYLAASYGTTTIELRAGRPLLSQGESRRLRAAAALDGDPIAAAGCLTLTPPVGAGRGRREQAIERVAEVLRLLRRRRGSVYAVEVGFGIGGWSEAEGRRLMAAVGEAGFRLKAATARYAPDGGVAAALEAGALSADYLVRLDEVEIDRVAESSTLATLMPAWAYHAGDEEFFPPARQLIDRGGAVALASDFSPDSPTLSMPQVMSLACRHMRMMPEEALAAVTINAAAAMGRADRIGSLEPGKQADLCVFDASDYREIPYYFGLNLCALTIRSGRVIFRAASPPPFRRSRSE